jgi:hypothetical protein
MVPIAIPDENVGVNVEGPVVCFGCKALLLDGGIISLCTVDSVQFVQLL